MKVRQRKHKINQIRAIAKANRDGCVICNGWRGGVKGNENVIDGKVVCDYCTVDIMHEQRAQNGAGEALKAS